MTSEEVTGVSGGFGVAPSVDGFGTIASGLVFPSVLFGPLISTGILNTSIGSSSTQTFGDAGS